MLDRRCNERQTLQDAALAHLRRDGYGSARLALSFRVKRPTRQRAAVLPVARNDLVHSARELSTASLLRETSCPCVDAAGHDVAAESYMTRARQRSDFTCYCKRSMRTARGWRPRLLDQRRKSSQSVIAALALVVSSGGAFGQSEPRHTISLELISTIRSAGSMKVSDQVSGVGLAFNGDYLVTSWDDSLGRVARYSNLGRLLKHSSIGGRDSMRIRRPLVSLGSNLLAFDARGSRMWIIGKADTVLTARDFPLSPWIREIIQLSDGRYVVSGAMHERSLSGQPLHVFNPDWTWVRSFGLQRPSLTPGGNVKLWRYLARCEADEAFWAAPRTEHRIEKWSLAGRLLDTIADQPAWFARQTSSRDLLGNDQARVVALDCDTEGNLWLISLVPHAVDSSTTTITGPTARTVNQLLDTYVEVFDVNTRTLVAMRRFDAAFVFHVSERLIGWFNGNGDSLSIKIGRLRMVP